MLEAAMWAHGHSMAIEVPVNIKSEWRAGFFIRVIGKPNTTNWFHFAVPTTVIVNDNRLRIDSAMLRMRSGSTLADITNVHVFDGENRVFARDNMNFSPTAFGLERFSLPNSPMCFGALASRWECASRARLMRRTRWNSRRWGSISCPKYSCARPSSTQFRPAGFAR